jgi:FkbM family methyltransferase
VLSSVVFSEAGLRVFPRVAPYLKRAYNVILNNELTPSINGEYWLIKQFPHDGVYVDVGYHRGDWSDRVVAEHHAARVIAFDPWPDAASFHASSKNARRVEFVPYALSDQEGTSVFFDYDNACNSLAARDLQKLTPARKYDVDITTLDAWAMRAGVRKIDLLKIDVEGYDLPVLKGAAGLLRAHAIDAFAFEYDDAWIYSRHFLGEAAEYIESVGYRLCKLFNGFVAPFAYHIEHETFAPAMYVGLSPRLWDEHRLPVRPIAL